MLFTSNLFETRNVVLVMYNGYWSSMHATYCVQCYISKLIHLKDMLVYLLLTNVIEYGNKHSVVVLFLDLKDSNLSP